MKEEGPLSPLEAPETREGVEEGSAPVFVVVREVGVRDVEVLFLIRPAETKASLFPLGRDRPVEGSFFSSLLSSILTCHIGDRL